MARPELEKTNSKNPVTDDVANNVISDSEAMPSFVSSIEKEQFLQEVFSLAESLVTTTATSGVQGSNVDSQSLPQHRVSGLLKKRLLLVKRVTKFFVIICIALFVFVFGLVNVTGARRYLPKEAVNIDWQAKYLQALKVPWLGADKSAYELLKKSFQLNYKSPEYAIFAEADRALRMSDINAARLVLNKKTTTGSVKGRRLLAPYFAARFQLANGTYKLNGAPSETLKKFCSGNNLQKPWSSTSTIVEFCLHVFRGFIDTEMWVAAKKQFANLTKLNSQSVSKVADLGQTSAQDFSLHLFRVPDSIIDQPSAVIETLSYVLGALQNPSAATIMEFYLAITRAHQAEIRGAAAFSPEWWSQWDIWLARALIKTSPGERNKVVKALVNEYRKQTHSLYAVRWRFGSPAHLPTALSAINYYASLLGEEPLILDGYVFSGELLLNQVSSLLALLTQTYVMQPAKIADRPAMKYPKPNLSDSQLELFKSTNQLFAAGTLLKLQKSIYLKQWDDAEKTLQVAKNMTAMQTFPWRCELKFIEVKLTFFGVLHEKSDNKSQDFYKNLRTLQGDNLCSHFTWMPLVQKILAHSHLPLSKQWFAKFRKAADLSEAELVLAKRWFSLYNKANVFDQNSAFFLDPALVEHVLAEMAL